MPQRGKHRLTWRIVDGPIVEDKRTNCRGLPDRPGNAGSPASTGGHGPLLHLHDHLRRPLCGNPYCRSDRRARTPEIQPVAAEPAERLAGYEIAGSRRIITHRPAAADFLRRSSAILVASSLVRAMPRNIWIMPSEGFSTSAPHPCGCTRAGAASRTSAAPVRRSRRTDFRRPRSCIRSCIRVCPVVHGGPSFLSACLPSVRPAAGADLLCCGLSKFTGRRTGTRSNAPTAEPDLSGSLPSAASFHGRQHPHTHRSLQKSQLPEIK